jgi:uncharacterized protein with NRDE domain
MPKTEIVEEFVDFNDTTTGNIWISQTGEDALNTLTDDVIDAQWTWNTSLTGKTEGDALNTLTDDVIDAQWTWNTSLTGKTEEMLTGDSKQSKQLIDELWV